MRDRGLHEILEKVNKSSELLLEARLLIEKEISSSGSIRKGKKRFATVAQSDEQLKEQYELLIKAYRDKGTAAIYQYVGEHSPRELRRFFEVNHLPIDTKKSKATIVSGLARCVAESSSIRSAADL